MVIQIWPKLFNTSDGKDTLLIKFVNSTVKYSINFTSKNYACVY